LISC